MKKERRTLLGLFRVGEKARSEAQEGRHRKSDAFLFEGWD